MLHVKIPRTFAPGSEIIEAKKKKKGIWLIPGLAASSPPSSGVTGRAKGAAKRSPHLGAAPRTGLSGVGWRLRARGSPSRLGSPSGGKA